MKSTLIAVTAMMMLAGCTEAYRYPCQDPKNVANKECIPPQCEIEGGCSWQLLGKENPKVVEEETAPVAEEAVESNVEIDTQEDQDGNE